MPLYFGIEVVNRKKAVAWVVSNLVISAEGVYSTGPGTNEVEYSTINSDGTLAPWIAASANPINANVYNAAAILSPLLTTTTLAPRMVLLGGQQFTIFQQSNLTSEVYYNNAP